MFDRSDYLCVYVTVIHLLILVAELFQVEGMYTDSLLACVKEAFLLAPSSPHVLTQVCCYLACGVGGGLNNIIFHTVGQDTRR